MNLPPRTIVDIIDHTRKVAGEVWDMMSYTAIAAAVESETKKREEETGLSAPCGKEKAREDGRNERRRARESRFRRFSG
jgi:hypothetical protein